MLPDYLYFVALAALLVAALPALFSPRGRRRLLASLPTLAFFGLLLLTAEIAFRVGRSQGGGDTGDAAAIVYTCSMHPQIRMPGPGKCPVCHMDLVPLGSPGTMASAHEVHIDPVVVQNMGVRVTKAARGPLHRSVRAFGELRAAENRLHDVALKFDGFVEQLMADTEGMAIANGAPLFAVYSPELVVAQAELIAARKSGDAALLQAARQKLRLFDVADAEIDRLQALDEPERALRWPAPAGGVLLQKNVVAGAPAEKNRVLLRIADLSVLWLDAQVPEGQLADVAPGMLATAALPSQPEVGLEGRVIFVAPEVDRATRTGTVRIETGSGSLRPGMFARVHIALPDVDALLVPQEAVIDTGSRELAWVAVGDGRFEPRLVRTGRRGDDGSVEVLRGLRPGDQVVVSGQFLIDAESRLREGARKWSEADTMPGGDLPPPDAATVGAATQQAVDRLLAAYLEVQQALAADRADFPAWQQLQEAANVVAAAPEPTVQQPAAALAQALQRPVADLEAMRVQFKAVSAAALRLFEPARPEGSSTAPTLFVQHCPMAEADWLQLDAATKNPYYGSSMLDCGAVRRELPLREAGK